MSQLNLQQEAIVIIGLYKYVEMQVIRYKIVG
jgi:hypothetical protein